MVAYLVLAQDNDKPFLHVVNQEDPGFSKKVKKGDSVYFTAGEYDTYYTGKVIRVFRSYNL